MKFNFTPWYAGDLQHRSRQPVHQPRIYRLIKEHGIPISMDGRGCWRDNVFVERLWRIVKYEEVYLYTYETICAAQQGLERY